MIKKLGLQEDIIILNLYAIYSRDSIYMKQKLKELEKAIIIVGDLNIHLSAINRTTRQNISKCIEDLYTSLTNLTYCTSS